MRANATKCLAVLVSCITGLITHSSQGAATLTGTFGSLQSGQVVNLSAAGSLDWVHWGLYTSTSVDRKAGVTPLIGNFTTLSSGGDSNAYVYAYQYSDNPNGYTWSDGAPTASVTNTTTGVWAYGFPPPPIGTGFEITVPADTTVRTLKVYVGVFDASGGFDAFLNDGSGLAYTDSSLSSFRGTGNGVYTLQYAANSSGQTLTIRWTVLLSPSPNGNATLQSAALSGVGANNPPVVSITSPAENATFTAPANITITANASDLDGAISKVEFFDGATKLGQSTSSPYILNWNNASLGYHVLTAVATDTNADFSSSMPVEIFVNGSGGSLTGSRAVPTNRVNLTLEGTSDWAHWGLDSETSFDHKNGVAQQISDFTVLGTNSVQRLSDNFTAYSWADGTPTPNATNSTTGVFIYGVTNGFQIQAPADTTPRRLKVYVGLYGARGNFQAYLSDFSARAYTDTTLTNVFDNSYAVYTLDYSAASAGQSLIVEFKSFTLYDFDFGNVTLQAATLLGTNSVTDVPPNVNIASPTNGALFPAPVNLTVVANAWDTDGTVKKVEFFQGANKLGERTNSPYSLVWSNVASGSYSLSARATDNGGYATMSSPITISVTNSSSSLAVTLEHPALAGSSFVFSFISQAGHTYEVDYSSVLGSGGWQVLTNLTGTGSTLNVTNKNVPATQRFYRVQTQ